MGDLNKGNITEIFPIRSDLPSELCQIRIVAYWQGSTELEEQTAALNSKICSGNFRKSKPVRCHISQYCRIRSIHAEDFLV